MDGRRLTKGWEKFAVAHNLEVGDILVFRHEGDLLFHVTPFGLSCCEILYSQKDEKDVKDKTGKLSSLPYFELKILWVSNYDNRKQLNVYLWSTSVRNGKPPVLQIFPLERNEDSIGKHSKKNHQEVVNEFAKEETNVESSSLSDNSSFVVSVTISNLREDTLCLLMRLSRSNILDENFHEISLMNKQGRTWTLNLKCSKSSGKFSISRG